MSPRDLTITAIAFVLGGTLAFGGSRLLAPGVSSSTGTPEPAAAPEPDPDCEIALDQAEARLQAARADVEAAQDLLDRMRGPVGTTGDSDAPGDTDAPAD